LHKNQETSWQKASACLDASAKIYGYRVDSVHHETFRFLGGLSRADKEDENPSNDAEDGSQKVKKREGRHDGFNTIESDKTKLDLIKYDLEFEVDPLFKLMTVKFGDQGARGLILKNLPLDEKLDILLESKAPKDITKDYEEEIEKQLAQEENSIKPEIREIIDKTLNNFNVNDLKSLQVCPDLPYFKKSRDLETSLDRTFYDNLMQEFDESVPNYNLVEDEDNYSLNESFNIGDNIENDPESQEISNSNRSSYGSHMSGKFDEGMNMNLMNMTQANFMSQVPGVGAYMDGFSYLRSEDIKEYIHTFGDGNKEVFKNMPQYKMFAKSFNQLEKMNKVVSVFNDDKKEKPKKKEEVLFDFSVENEVKKLEIFEKESKTKKNVVTKDTGMKKFRRKVKQLYHYDKSLLFNLFSIQDRFNAANQEKIDEVGAENENNEFNENQNDYSVGGEDINMNQENNDNPAVPFLKVDADYEKKFGRLYKTFDVKVVKQSIWQTIHNFDTKTTKSKAKPILPKDENAIDFKQVITNISSNLGKEVLNNISTPTCFVCLLHLSNEKSKIYFNFLDLILEQISQDNFIIKREPGDVSRA